MGKQWVHFKFVAEFRTRHCELQQSAEHGATKQSLTALLSF